MIRLLLFSALILTVPALSGEKEDIQQRRNTHFCSSLVTSYDSPLMIIRGKGQYLYDENEVAYLDAYNNVAHVGHCHPKVVAAASQQLAVLNTNTRYLHPLLVEYGERLLATLPDELDTVFFVNSGSEANDLAYRLARRFTGARECLMLENSYHGTTYACVQISGTKMPHHDKSHGVHLLPVPDTYQGRYRDTEAAIHSYISHAQTKISSLIQSGHKLAAFFVEPIQGCGGNLPMPPKYLRETFAAARLAGALCVADEVQVGFGRTGDHFWAFQSHDVIPDIVTMGKPMGNGYPIAAVVTRKEVAEKFADIEYFNTFGGSTAACAVGLACLDVIEEEELQLNAREVGSYIMSELSKLRERHSAIGEIRGRGLYIGVELVKNQETRQRDNDLAHEVVQQLKNDHHILTGCERNVLRIKPPLCFNKENADQLVHAIDIILTGYPCKSP